MNTQPILKQDLSTSALSVVSIFGTIQGEGPFAGRPAIFIRLGGCNLQCPQCDTDYTTTQRFYSVDAILNEVIDTPVNSKLVVITGGEPFRQNIIPLVNALDDAHFEIQIETNGTLTIPGFPYWLTTIVCAPKTGSIKKSILPHISAVKYVVDADSISEDDGLPLMVLGHSNNGEVCRAPLRYLKKERVYVQPVDTGDAEQNKRHLDAAINSCFNFGYTLCLQQHKILDLE